MSVADRRQREKQALRQEILTAARQLFAKEGYESVSMRRIAQKIEYSPTTIYLYFKDKQDLIHQICEETFALLTKKVEKAIGKNGDPVARLKLGLRAYVDFGIQHPNHYRTTFLTPRDEHDWEEKTMAESQGMRAFQCLVRAVTECIEARRFRESDVMAISQYLWMAVHGITSLQITHSGFPWVEQSRLIDLAIDSAVRGLLR